MNKFLIAATLLFASTTFAHEGEQPPQGVNPQQDVMLSMCLTHAARASWGADARFHNAPSVFKYIPAEDTTVTNDDNITSTVIGVKSYMSGRNAAGDKVETPRDGIYVAEELNLTQRKDYEVSAFFGWKQADVWVKEGKKPLDRFFMIGLFMEHCKKAMDAAELEDKH